MQKDKELRYQSAGELQEDLQGFLEGKAPDIIISQNISLLSSMWIKL